jgi:hypothetical protein
MTRILATMVFGATDLKPACSHPLQTVALAPVPVTPLTPKSVVAKTVFHHVTTHKFAMKPIAPASNVSMKTIALPLPRPVTVSPNALTTPAGFQGTHAPKGLTPCAPSTDRTIRVAFAVGPRIVMTISPAPPILAPTVLAKTRTIAKQVFAMKT